MALSGLFGAPFVDLEPRLSSYVDLGALGPIHEEICLALASLPLASLSFTGGSHKSMGIVPEAFADDPYADYGQAIARMSRDELVVFASLSDAPLDVDALASVTFGEERDVPLSERQMRYLKFRYGVYFPWKVYYELMPNARWADKSDARGKRFTNEALSRFPRTVAFVRRLPFERIGSCKILGLEANDHGTVHRDAEPGGEDATTPPAEFVSFCPRGDKRFFVYDGATGEKTFAPSRAYWFSDADYHGVEADPFFRYSVRVDGVFRADFRQSLREERPRRA